MAIDVKGVLSPLSAVGTLFKHPKTITYPEVKRDFPHGYRGFHINNLEDCIGCANCQEVCMNEAIDMVKTDKEYNPKNSSACIPRIDYGRCCWCSLCTDVCPPNSLKLDRECIHADTSGDNFLYMPKNQKDIS
jgi:glutamate synthase (NADPH/NADH) small chain/NADH-quinone oxidoreductase subunit I